MMESSNILRRGSGVTLNRTVTPDSFLKQFTIIIWSYIMSENDGQRQPYHEARESLPSKALGRALEYAPQPCHLNICEGDHATTV